jgi:membrane-associated phospholipid phosphatase
VRRSFRPEEVLLVAYVVVLGVTMAATGVRQVSFFQHPRFLQVTAGLALAIYVREVVRAARARGLVILALRAGVAPAAAVLRDFVPFFAGLVLYEMLHDLTPVVRPQVVDAALVAIDRAVFGVDVAHWLGRFATPSLTWVMVQCYASYFIAPVLLAAGIYLASRRALFREYMVSLTIVTLLGYLGYLLVPAVGPYVFQAELFPTRLPGGGAETHFFIREIDTLRGVARDCFPSMHTAHTTVVLAFAWRFSRVAFLVYLPIALGLYVSTVYLRMHYVVDVAAGFGVSALAVALGPRLERWWWATLAPATEPDAARAA